LHIRFIANVEVEHQGFVPQLPGNGGVLPRIAAGDRYPSTRLAQPKRDAPSKATVTAGDEGDFPR
jgi:hypothetical protein